MNTNTPEIRAADRRLSTASAEHFEQTLKQVLAELNADQAGNARHRLTLQIQARIYRRRAEKAAARVQEAKLAFVIALCAEARRPRLEHA